MIDKRIIASYYNYVPYIVCTLIFDFTLFICKNRIKNPGLLPGFWGGVMHIDLSSLYSYTRDLFLQREETISLFSSFSAHTKVGLFVKRCSLNLF